MKVLGLSGSMRKEGNTAQLIRVILKRCEDEGIKTEFISLAGKKINPCLGCEKCKKKKWCVIENDDWWGDGLSRTYEVSLHIEAIDRPGLLRDVSKVLADEKVDVIGVNTLSNKVEQTNDMTITIEIGDLQQLGKVMDKIGMLPNIIRVTRNKH